MKLKFDVKLIAYTRLNEEELPNLSLLSTNQGAALSSIAASQCYSAGKYLLSEADFSTDPELTQKVAESGHTSILEHASASFLITGVSRALSHQLVRHRLASYTQQSQRYTDQSNFEYVVPPSIQNTPEAYAIYVEYMKNTQETYKRLLDIITQKNHAYKKTAVQQDIRFILPNAATTQLVMTMNYRELGHFLSERMCTRAQWEIRNLASKIFDLMIAKEPLVFSPRGIFKGSKCYNLGYCPEKKSCGLKPKRDK